MFIKGSRYRHLPESSPVDAAGERLLGKDLREIAPPLVGPFQHTVQQGDRLDLLSFKYYRDPTKWWQIADANPQEPFPPDLLDRSPLVNERFVLANPNFETRLKTLVDALSSSFGAVTMPEVTSFTDAKPAEPSFIATTVIVTYTPAPATHQDIINLIEAAPVRFHFLSALVLADAPNTVESFTFDDQQTRNAWRNMTSELAAIGVLELGSAIVESILDLVYNGAATPRESILTIIQANGFTLQPATTVFPAVGSKIVIPPYQTV